MLWFVTFSSEGILVSQSSFLPKEFLVAKAAEDLGTKAYGKKSKIYRMKPPRVAGSLLLNSTEDLYYMQICSF